MEKNLTNRFLEDICNLIEKPMPEEVIFQAKMCLIDYLGCTYLGAKVLSTANEKYFNLIRYEKGNTRVWGANKRISMHGAALINGYNSHAEELDDGHRFGMMHVGGVVVSAMLALADNFTIKAEDFLRGIVFGYECAIRLASAIQPGHKLKGYHTTATCGTVGAAFGMGVALGYSQNQLKAVLSAAVSDAAGVLEIQENKSQLKPYNVGRAATGALNAMLMGGIDLDGPEDIIGGPRGFLKVMTDQVKEEYLFGFGDKYAIECIYRKPYAACRHCHAAIEGAILGAKEIPVEKIKEIKVETYNLAIKGHDHKEICGASSAKLSMPYSVATGVLFGDVGFSHYEEQYLSNQSIYDMMDKIVIMEDPELSALVPAKRAAIVTITSKDGKTATYRVDYPKGEPENPMDKNDIETKYFSLMDAANVSREQSTRILEEIWNIETKYEAFLEEM